MLYLIFVSYLNIINCFFMFKYFMFNMFSFVFKSRVDYLNIVLVIILSRIQFGLFYFIFIILLHFIFGRPKAQAQEQGQIGAHFTSNFRTKQAHDIAGPNELRPNVVAGSWPAFPRETHVSRLQSVCFHARPGTRRLFILTWPCAFFHLSPSYRRSMLPATMSTTRPPLFPQSMQG